MCSHLKLLASLTGLLAVPLVVALGPLAPAAPAQAAPERAERAQEREPERRAAARRTTAFEKAVHRKTNGARNRHGRRDLRPQRCVDRFAESQARAMMRRGTGFHQNLSRVLRRCDLGLVGENVAWGYFAGPAQVVRAWMDSPGHRRNILDGRFGLLGVGAVRDARGEWYVAQVFGRR